MPLQNGSFNWAGDDVSTASLPFGPTPIEIRATDTLGNSVATVISRIHDNPPSVEILSPQPDTLARPNVRFHARCTDDGGPCQLTLEGVTGVTGANEIDRIVSLAELQRFSAERALRVSATDSLGQIGGRSQNVWVEPSPRLSLVASYPGVIQDIDTSRALVFTNESPRRVLIVNRLTGVARPSSPSSTELAAGGAVDTVWRAVRGIDQQHRGAALRVDAHRSRAAWAGRQPRSLRRQDARRGFMGALSREREMPGYLVYDLVGRDLRTGDEVAVQAGTIKPGWTSDLAANGDVVFRRGSGFAYDLVRYRQGVLEPLAVAASGINYARTDGTFVVAEVYSSNQGYSCLVQTPNGPEVLAQHASGFGFDLRVQEGWVACRMVF